MQQYILSCINMNFLLLTSTLYIKSKKLLYSYYISSVCTFYGCFRKNCVVVCYAHSICKVSYLTLEHFSIFSNISSNYLILKRLTLLKCPVRTLERRSVLNEVLHEFSTATSRPERERVRLAFKQSKTFIL